QLLNSSLIARSLELSTTAINHYLDILEGALMIIRLPPFFINIKKRLVKRPKIYIRDTGLLHRLAGLRKESELENWLHRGSSFEGLVVEELCSLARIQLTSPKFFFYRTHAGAEVDLLIQDGKTVLPIEVKHGIEVTHHDTAGLQQCMEDLDIKKGWIVTRGDRVINLGKGIAAVPWEWIVAGRITPWDESINPYRKR
ncbi:MAG: DUF4143 domain-containing protein, partial [Spirochaetota bacterium]